MITIEFLNSVRGDKPMYVEDGEPEQRKKIASRLMELLKEGQAIFLIQGNETRRITGYDETNNQWKVQADPQPRPEQAHEPVAVGQPRRRGRPPKHQYFPASGTRVTAIGRSAGG